MRIVEVRLRRKKNRVRRKRRHIQIKQIKSAEYVKREPERQGGWKPVSCVEDAKSRQRNDQLVASGEVTLREYVESYWLQTVAKQNLAPKSLAIYQELLSQKILPVLGDFKLSEIRPVMVNSLYASLGQPGAKQNGGAYSLGSIRKVATVLSSVMHSAVRLEIIPSNPCKNVTPAGPKTPKIKYFTPEQSVRFLEYLEQPRVHHVSGSMRHSVTGTEYFASEYDMTKWVPLQMKVLFNLALYTGARKGELLALQWENIDFNHSMVSIRKAVSVVHGQKIIKETKTRASWRDVAVSTYIISMLRELRQQQDQRRAESDPGWNPAGWLFTTYDGDMMSYYTPYNALQNLIKQYNEGRPDGEQLPLISFHALRHTNATMLIASKQDIETIANRLGHANAKVTLGIYGHPLKEGNMKAAVVLDSLLCPTYRTGRQEDEFGRVENAV